LLYTLYFRKSRILEYYLKFEKLQMSIKHLKKGISITNLLKEDLVLLNFINQWKSVHKMLENEIVSMVYTYTLEWPLTRIRN